MKKRPHRLSVELSEEQYQKLRQFLEHGMQKKIFSIMVDDLIALFERYGLIIIPMMLEKKITYDSYIAARLRRERGREEVLSET